MPVAYSADNQSLYHPERDITLLCDSDWPDEIALAAELSRLAYLRAEKTEKLYQPDWTYA